ncbi:hypothetical protein PAHAL_8G170900 [Panicum hallii]|uniref:Uncharacterized protein n=1 Tax=Panicum hallii TaxID=206008 RepID=A0A2S3IE78_9POAL|nr:hypothetical protein PAHAL_8G170900 [Panicum hallii]PAN42566.1 hypothetical protein PAHAL_8G170900 [Panicum hallii]
MEQTTPASRHSRAAVVDKGKRHHGRRGRAHRGHGGRAPLRSRTSRAPAWWWRPHNKHHGRTADAVLLMGHTSAHEQKRPMRRRRIRRRSWVGCLLDSSG